MNKKWLIIWWESFQSASTKGRRNKKNVIRLIRDLDHKAVLNMNVLLVIQCRDGTGQDFLDPTRPVIFKSTAGWPAGRQAGQPVSDRPGWPFFLQKDFVHWSMYLMKNFQKGGHVWGVKICDFGRWSQKKKNAKNFCVFWKITQF